MNNQEITALLRDDVTTIQCVFLHGAQNEYTFFCLKELAKEVDIDDLVLVDTQNGVSLAQVRSLENKLGTGELQEHIKYRYVFDKVRMSKLTDILDANKQVESALSKHRRETARFQALAALGITDQNDVKKLLSDIKGDISNGND